MSCDRNTVFVDIMSVNSSRSLADLVKESYSDQVPFFDVSIGKYIKQWRGVKRGNHLVYSIDNVGLCGGEIRYVKTRAFRPLWLPDYESYKTFVGFVRSMCHESYDDEWKEEMIRVGVEAIDQKRWLFVAFAVMAPNYFYHSNKIILEEKIQEMARAEREMEEMVSLAYSTGGG